MKDWQLHVERARGGDRSSFDLLIEQFGDMAVGYAYSILARIIHDHLSMPVDGRILLLFCELSTS